MLIEMRAWLPGEREKGEPWPGTGGRVDVPDEQAQALIDVGHAVAVDDEGSADEAAGSDAPLDGPAATGLADATKADLQAAAEERGLATTGTKAELLERIQEHDAG